MSTRSQLIPRPEVLDVPVYSRAAASSVPVTIRASSNEAPFGPSPAVCAAVTARLASADLYPVIGAEDLNQALADALGLTPAEIASADGSLSLLNYLLLTYCRPGSQVVFSWRSYEAYPICVLTAGAVPVPVPSTASGSHDLTAMREAITEHTAAVIICSPNNPTGAHVTHSELVAFLDSVPQQVLVVLDEAYRDFDLDADAPRALDLHERYPNLVVLRTFSKAYGLAGLRIGFAIGAPDVIENTRRILPPFPVNALAVEAALVALSEDEPRHRTVAKVVHDRDDLQTRAQRLGVPFVPSHSNFVWFPLGESADELGRACAQQGMSVRVFPGEGTRISVGFDGVADAFERAVTLSDLH